MWKTQSDCTDCRNTQTVASKLCNLWEQLQNMNKELFKNKISPTFVLIPQHTFWKCSLSKMQSEKSFYKSRAEGMARISKLQWRKRFKMMKSTLYNLSQDSDRSNVECKLELNFIFLTFKFVWGVNFKMVTVINKLLKIKASFIYQGNIFIVKTKLR